MKKILIIMSVVMLITSACKTNENNYRAAYEKAKERRTETGDSATTAAFRDSQMPKEMTFDGVTLPVMTFPATIYKEKGVEAPQMYRYCVVTGRFRQIFNASSMCERLRGFGYDGAFVLQDRDKNYYVVAGTTAEPAEASALIERLKKDESVVVRSPFPYVVRPAHLVR